MAEIPPLNVKVIIDATGVATGVQTATAGLEQISAKAKASTTSLGKLRTVALGVFGGNVLTAGAAAVSKMLSDMRQSAIATQYEMNRLETAIDNMGNVTEKQAAKIKANVGAFGSLGFGGEESAAAMTNLLRQTGSVSQSYKLMAIAADVARDRNIDLASAAQLVGRGTKGAMQIFKMYGIALDENLPKNKAISKAFDELNAKVGGTAQKSTDTLAVKWAIFKEQLSAIGDVLANKVMPYLAKLLEFVSKNITAILILGGVVLITIGILKTYATVTAALKAIQQAYAFWTYAQAASTNVFRFALQSLWATMMANPVAVIVAAVVALGVAFIAAWNKWKGFREAIINGVQMIINAFAYLLGVWSKMLGALGKVPGFGWAKKASEALGKAAEASRKYGDSLDKLANKKIKTPKIPGITGQVKPGEPTGIKGDFQGKGGDKGTVQYVTVYASNTNDIAKKLSKAAKNGQPIGGK